MKAQLEKSWMPYSGSGLNRVGMDYENGYYKKYYRKYYGKYDGGGAKIRLWKTIDKGQYETEKKHSVPKL